MCAIPPRTAARVSAAHFGPFYCGRSGVTGIPYRKPERCPGVAVLVDGALLTAVVSDAPYILHIKWVPLFSCRGRWHYPLSMLLFGVGTAIAPRMLKGAEAHTLLVSGAQISKPLARRTPRQHIDLQRFFTRLSRPLPHLASSRRPPYRQHVYQQ